MLAHVSKAAFKNRGRPHVSRSSFSAAIIVSKVLTLGSGWAESMYKRATEMKTLKFTISGCCIGNLKWRSYVASLSLELSGSERVSRGQGGKKGGTGQRILLVCFHRFIPGMLRCSVEQRHDIAGWLKFGNQIFLA